jgi:2-keto-4-pentenoate hydratase
MLDDTLGPALATPNSSFQLDPWYRSGLVPNDLGQLLVFVAEFLQAFGHTLEPGDLVLSGSYLATAVPLPPGATAKADFGLLGSVEISVAA